MSLVYRSDYATYESGAETQTTEGGYLPKRQDSDVGFASNILVTWNMMNQLLSVSLLAFPYIVSRGGFVVLIFIVVIAVIMSYTSRIVVDLMYVKYSEKEEKARIRQDYLDLCRATFDSRAPYVFIQIVQTLEMFAICVLNVCILGHLLHEIRKSFDIKICVIIVGIVALPMFCIQKLAIIGWMQTIAVISLAIAYVILQSYCLINYKEWSSSSIPVFNLDELPIVFGVIVYAYGIHSVLPGLEERMKEPNKYGKIVSLTFLKAAIIQCIFSVTNAVAYGSKTDELIVIQLDRHFGLGVTTAVFIGLSILAHFSLPTFVVMGKLDNAISNYFPQCFKRFEIITVTFKMFSRVVMLAAAVAINILVPDFAHLMAFIGSTISVWFSLIIPCLFHIKLRSAEISYFILGMDIFALIFGCTVFITGAYFIFYRMYIHSSSFSDA